MCSIPVSVPARRVFNRAWSFCPRLAWSHRRLRLAPSRHAENTLSFPSLFTHVRPALHTCVERTRQRNQARTTMGESATPVKAVPEAASSSASPPPPTSAQIPPRPASKPVGELYRIRPWHTVIVLTLALLLDLPFLIDRLALSPYTSHTTGGVLVTGASTGIGRDAAITLATKEPGLIVYAGVRNCEKEEGE